MRKDMKGRPYRKYKGEEILLNEDLISMKGVEDNVEQILDLHCEQIDLYEKAQNAKSSDELKELAVDLEDLEFRMQDAWNWKRDATKHTHWLFIPHCTCPKMDNRDPIYAGRRIISGSCPVHSTGAFKSEDKG